MQVIALTALVASAASAQVRQLTFEGLQNNEAIGNFYNGGTGGDGSGPGPAWGITFSSTALALTSGNFVNPPSAPTIMFWLEANPIMNVAPGFTTGFSTFYTNTTQVGSIDIFSGLNATGSLLGTINLPALGSCSPGPAYCNWAGVGTNFAGTAFSVRFNGSANFIGFDNVTFGSDRPQTIIPEPSTYALLATGMAGLAFARRRRRQG